MALKPNNVERQHIMAATPGPWTPVNQFRTKLGKATYDLSASSRYYIVLVTSASNLSTSSTLWSSVTGEVANANGYTTGGVAVTMTPTGTTSVAWPIGTNPVWTAAGGSITAAKAALRDTTSGDVLFICTLDTTAGGTDVVANVGENITLDSDGAPAPVFTLG